MPRLDSFKLTIKTGQNPGPEKPKFAINSFPLDFDEIEGGAGSGETLKATGNPQSFPHSLVLRGPDSGLWDIESVTATYYVSGEEPYTVRMGAATLDEESDLNIWHERPAPVFDV